MPSNSTERRRFERFSLVPGYTAVEVKAPGGGWRAGHVYDLSERGVRFDLDEAIAPGTIVEVRLEMPRAALGPSLADDVAFTGEVVWCDADDPVCTRLGVEITAFANAEDRERLIRRLSAGRFQRAA